MDTQFPATPSTIFFDPLAELLGVGDGFFHYTFDDVVKLLVDILADAGEQTVTIGGK